MQTPPCAFLEGRSKRNKLYAEISQLLSSNGILESRYVSNIRVMSNL